MTPVHACTTATSSGSRSPPSSATTTCASRCCSTPCTRASAACWCAARRARRSRRPCARWPRCCPTVDVVAGCRFSCDPAAPDPDCPDGPHAGGRGRPAPGPAGRAAGRRHRGPAASARCDLERALAEGVPRLRARAARRRAPRRALRRRGQPAARPPGRPAARRRRDGPGARRARRRVGVARRPVPAGRHDEPGGGRAAAAAARPVRADRRGARRRATSTPRAEVVRRRLAFEADPAAFAATLRRGRGGDWPRRIADARGPARRRWCCPTPSCAGSPRCARRSTSTGCAPTSSSPAPRSRTPPGGARTRSRRRTSGSRPGSRCRTGAAATRSTSPGLDEHALDEALDGADEPEPDARPGPDGPDRRPGGGAEPGRRRRRRRRERGVGARLTSAAVAGAGRRARRPATARAAPRPPPPSRSAPGCSSVPGVGEGAPGRRSRARTELGRVVRASATPARRAADCTCRPPCSRPRPHQHARGRVSGRACCTPRRPAPRRARGPRGQPGAVRRRRLRVDGRAAADGGGQRRGAVAAARRLPAPRQGRPDHLPRHGRRAGAAADLRRCTPPRRRLAALRTGGRTPLADGLLRGPRGAGASSGCATRARRALLVVLTDGRATGGPDPARPGRDACRAAALLAADGVADRRGRLRDAARAARPGRASSAGRRGRDRWCGSTSCRADRVADVVHAARAA